MIGVTVENADTVRKALLLLVQSTRSACKRELRKAAISTASKAKSMAPKAMGTLRDSIIPNTSELEQLRTSVEVQAPYGAFVEGVFHQGRYGRAPGKWPPYMPILRWIIAKGIHSKAWKGRTVAKAEDLVFPIRRKIGQKGTPAQPFLFPAEQIVRPDFEAAIKRIMTEAAKSAGIAIRGGA